MIWDTTWLVGLLAERDEQFNGESTFAQRAWIAFDEAAPPAEQATKERREQAELAAAFAQVKPAGLIWTVTRPGKGHAGIYHPAAMEAFHALYGPPGP